MKRFLIFVILLFSLSAVFATEPEGNYEAARNVFKAIDEVISYLDSEKQQKAGFSYDDIAEILIKNNFVYYNMNYIADFYFGFVSINIPVINKDYGGLYCSISPCYMQPQRETENFDMEQTVIIADICRDYFGKKYTLIDERHHGTGNEISFNYKTVTCKMAIDFRASTEINYNYFYISISY